MLERIRDVTAKSMSHSTGSVGSSPETSDDEFQQSPIFTGTDIGLGEPVAAMGSNKMKSDVFQIAPVTKQTSKAAIEIVG